MHSKTPGFYVPFIFLLAALPGGAANSLSIWTENVHGTFPAYLDEATAVVEPCVGYAAVSLFLTYSDHGRFPGRNVEIMHQFELPQGARVDDLWLWIGDSVMKAKIFETPRAQGIYDSIVDLKRDPAFLKLRDGQYDLRVYPLASGGNRKIKINFLVPIGWSGWEPRVSLPLGMLLANNASVKPLRVLFRAGEFGGDAPELLGGAPLAFQRNLDTLGYRYYETRIGDLSGFSRLDFSYHPNFYGGAAVVGKRRGDRSFFSVGIKPVEFFNLNPVAERSGKVLVGLDVSSPLGVDYDALAAELAATLPAVIPPEDSLKIVVVGEGLEETFPSEGWCQASTSRINGLLQGFRTGGIAAARKLRGLPRILMTDPETRDCWDFPGLNKISRPTYSTTRNIMGLLSQFRNAEIVASYGQGYEEKLTATQARVVLDTLVPFFDRGGIFLTYIDFNRDYEKIATALVRGLQIPPNFSAPEIVSPVAGSPIGRGLPSFHSSTHCVLVHADPDVTVEMTDPRGNPVVISKAIGRGRLIVSGLWSLVDPDAQKKALGTALLGLQVLPAPRQLAQLLGTLSREQETMPAHRMVVLSNSDFLTGATEADQTASAYLRSLRNRSQVDAIHLLDGMDYVPPAIFYQGEKYLGSALLLKSLADSTGGRFVSMRLSPWDRVREVLVSSRYLATTSLEVSVFPALPTNTSQNMFEILPMPADPVKPRFFIGQAPIADSLTVSFRARFTGIDSNFSRSLSFAVGSEQAVFGSGLREFFAGEQIGRLFSALPLDTAAIVRLALDNRLVTQYTALLALEPNDSIHFMRDPKDESGIPPTGLAVGLSQPGDSLGISGAYLSGSGGWRLTLAVPKAGKLELAVYDGAGRKVADWREYFGGAGGREFHVPAGRASTPGSAVCFVFARFTAEPGRKPLVKTARFFR